MIGVIVEEKKLPKEVVNDLWMEALFIEIEDNILRI
jgi:hypothetical protein